MWRDGNARPLGPCEPPLRKLPSRRDPNPSGDAGHPSCVHNEQQIVARRRDVTSWRRLYVYRRRTASGNFTPDNALGHVESVRRCAGADQYHLRNGCRAWCVYSEGCSMRHSTRSTRDHRSGTEVIPRKVSLVRSRFARLPSAADVLIAPHQDGTIRQQDRC